MEETRTLATIAVLKEKYKCAVFCCNEAEFIANHNYTHRQIYEELLELGIKNVRIDYDENGYASINVILPGRIHSIEATITLTT